MARAALIGARTGFEEGPLVARRLAAEIKGLHAENARLREELRIKDVRIAGIAPHRRSHYEPVERLAILCLRGAAGWSARETARRFLLAPATVASWMRRLDEGGTAALVETPRPVNRFPEFVAELVRTLKATLPSMGKVRIAQVLARAGIPLAPTTVARFLRKTVRHGPLPRPSRFGGPLEKRKEKPARVLTARYPHQLSHLDLTVVPTAAGFWIPWLPFSLPIVWPYSWTVAVVLDHFSRAVVAYGVYRKQPTTEEVCALLDRAILDAGRSPRHMVTDRGVQFQATYLDWCRRRRVRPRFGAIGKKGSIAVIERFIRSLKDECLRVIPVPLVAAAFRGELAAYVEWYGIARPHTALAGATPQERLRGRARGRDRLVSASTTPHSSKRISWTTTPESTSTLLLAEPDPTANGTHSSHDEDQPHQDVADREKSPIPGKKGFVWILLRLRNANKNAFGNSMSAWREADSLPRCCFPT